MDKSDQLPRCGLPKMRHSVCQDCVGAQQMQVPVALQVEHRLAHLGDPRLMIEKAISDMRVKV